jgi:prophage antirepressor-like protein
MSDAKNTTPALISFQFHGRDVTTIRDAQGEPWWKAADVCDACGIKNVSKACERLDADEKAVITLSDSVGRPQDMLIVNEAGLYALALSSRKPEAKEFKRWVTHDVLPQIRKTGQFSAAPTLPTLHDPSLQAILHLTVDLDATKHELAQVKEQAQRTEEKVETDFNNQNFWTVAEYVQFHDLRHQCPESAYVEGSRHMHAYCKRERLNFRDPNILPRRIPVGDKNWETEWGFHTSVYEAAFLPWLLRRNSQTSLTVLPGGESFTHDPGVPYTPRRPARRRVEA